MGSTELELLSLYAKTRDAEAFRTLVERHQNMVFATCRRILGNSADAEDAAQACFLELARDAEKLRPPVAGWLHSVSVHISIKLRRQNAARRAREAVAVSVKASAEPTWEDVRGYVDEAIQELPEDLRQPIVLHFLEGQSQENVAAELGVTQSAVSKRLNRGVESLRDCLRKSGWTVPAVALGALLTANAVEAAPITLIAALGKMALAGPGAAASTGTHAVAATAGKGIAAKLTILKGAGIVKLAGISLVAAAVVTAGVVVVNKASSAPPAAPAPVVQAAPAAPVALAPQVSHAVSSLVGEDCIFYVSFPSNKAAREAMKGLGPYKLFHDPQVMAFLQSADKDSSAALTADKLSLAEINGRVDDLLNAFDRQAVFSTFANWDGKSLDYMVVLESTKPDGAERWLDNVFKEHLLTTYFHWQLMPVQGAPNTYALDQRNDPPVLSAHGPFLIWSSRGSRATALTAAMEKPLPAPLDRADSWRKAMKEVRAENADACAFINVARTWDAILNFYQKHNDAGEVEANRQLRPWFDFDYAALAMHINGDRVSTTIAVAPKAGAKETILRYLVKQPNPLDTLEMVPSRAVLFSSVGLDLRAITNDALSSPDIVRELAWGVLYYLGNPDINIPRTYAVPKGAAPEPPAPVNRYDTTLANAIKGLPTILNTLVKNLKPEVSLFAMLPLGGGAIPEGGVILSTDKADSAEQSVQALAQFAKVQATSSDYAGARIFGFNQQGTQAQSLVSPVFGATDKELTLTLSPQTFKVLAGVRQNPKDLLRDTATFRKLLTEAGPERIGAFYLDTKSVALYAYNTLNPFIVSLFQLGKADLANRAVALTPATLIAIRLQDTLGLNSKIRFNPALLPTAEALARCLDSMTGYAKWEGETLVIHISSDGFDPASLAAHGAAYFPYSLPYLVRKPVTAQALGGTLSARMAEGIAGCGTIRTALRVYAVQHGGTYPVLTGVDGTGLAQIRLSATDLNGKYFQAKDYTVNSTATTYTIKATMGASTYIIDQNLQETGTFRTR